MELRFESVDPLPEPGVLSLYLAQYSPGPEQPDGTGFRTWWWLVWTAHVCS
ncbi:hypothetical protein [Pseudonocardia sp. ICBG1034]|uniref:hypothetical protein n=1 Tax=Pseudonocardia sp. ICBG1034 TaxID=2844381 RepID=UPI001CCC9D65|nr:hypothetical protein [Pseudonocardia sp. ICBG1034]